MTRSIRLTLIGKPDCHLCDDANGVVVRVLNDLKNVPGSPSISVQQLSVTDDEELRAKYANDIPVLLIDGKLHSYWWVDPEILKAALLNNTGQELGVDSSNTK